jgi:hypothetical protein
MNPAIARPEWQSSRDATSKKGTKLTLLRFVLRPALRRGRRLHGRDESRPARERQDACLSSRREGVCRLTESHARQHHYRGVAIEQCSRPERPSALMHSAVLSHGFFPDRDRIRRRSPIGDRHRYNVSAVTALRGNEAARSQSFVIGVGSKHDYAQRWGRPDWRILQGSYPFIF